ncbi:acyltransferase [Xylariaceae sp. FL0255]|nr:acyltransferase [Xylariaceae sp. FL0255]
MSSSPPSNNDNTPTSNSMASSLIMGLTASLSRVFIYGLNSVEVTGLQRFLDILDRRKDVEKRERGLITVSNHVCVIDDPLIWGVLPFKYAFNPSNHRWGLGAHDICFKNRPLSTFFFTGQVLPTHRGQHSPLGGLFQPTIPQAIRLLSARPFLQTKELSLSSSSSSSSSSPPPSLNDDIADPFTAGNGLTFTTNGIDNYPAPSALSQNKYSWLHIFPEGCVHQHPKLQMRYFKWGISRLILESEPMPDVLPMFIDGPQHVMAEDRKFPRFLPRAGKKFRIGFGELVDTEAVFGDLRTRWQDLVRREQERDVKAQGKLLAKRKEEGSEKDLVRPQRQRAMGDLWTDELKYGDEAVGLRIEVARRVRDEVLKVRRSMGYPDEDPPGFELAETWAREPQKDKFRSNVDDSLVNKRQ